MENPSETEKVVKLLEKQVEQNEKLAKDQRTGVLIEGFAAIGAVVLFIIFWRWVI